MAVFGFLRLLQKVKKCKNLHHSLKGVPLAKIKRSKKSFETRFFSQKLTLFFELFFGFQTYGLSSPIFSQKLTKKTRLKCLS